MKNEAGSTPRRIGRYLLHASIASGGMGSIHLGRTLGDAGFSRTVAIKCLHPHLAAENEFVTMFVDEARLASRVAHPNVAQTLDVVVDGDAVLVVMEYVHGESLGALLKRSARPLDCSIACGIVVQMLYGLHAAHEATGPDGRPLELVHRDVSPQNVVVSADGIARVVDFGVAKATWRLRETRDGALRGKLGYMAPEQLAWESLDRRADIYAAGVVLWESLVSRRLFSKDSSSDVGARARGEQVAPPSALRRDVPAAVDAVVMRALAPLRDDRFATARDMAVALEEATPTATARQIAEWVDALAHDSLAERAARVRELDDMEATPPASEKSAAPPSALALAARRLAQKEDATRSMSPPVAPSKWKRAAVALLGIALVGALSAALLRRDRGAPRDTPAAATTTGAMATASAPELPTASDVSVTPSGAVASDVPRALPKGAAGHDPKRARPRGAASSSTGKKDGACNPNYTIDADGVKRFKPECF